MRIVGHFWKEFCTSSPQRLLHLAGPSFGRLEAEFDALLLSAVHWFLQGVPPHDDTTVHSFLNSLYLTLFW
jgi:hypothetical protein